MTYRSVNPGTLLCPVPAVLVSCADRAGRANALAVAWTGILCSDPPVCSVSIRKERFSHGLILDTGEFVINLCSREMLRALDYCGVRSGRDEDKLAACGLKPLDVTGGLNYAPPLDRAPLQLCCRVEKTLPLGSHDLFIARIVSVQVRQDLMDENGKIDLEKARLIAYSHGVYHALGEALGFFGFSVASPEALRRRMAALKKQ